MNYTNTPIDPADQERIDSYLRLTENGRKAIAARGVSPLPPLSEEAAAALKLTPLGRAALKQREAYEKVPRS